MGESGLADPTVDPPSLYLSDDGVPTWRPIMFGDVFREIPCARGGDPEPLVMVMAHPCSMRHGTQMRPRVVTAQVVKSPPGKVDQSAWRGRYFDYFPLMGFDGAAGDEPLVVRLGELHAADTATLDVAKRVLALSDSGVAAVLQRWIYQLSRDPVPIDVLEELITPAMTEVELQEEWCNAAVHAGGDGAAPTVETAAIEFQDLLGKPGGGGLRDDLNSGELSSLASVRREVRKARVARYGNAGA